MFEKQLEEAAQRSRQQMFLVIIAVIAVLILIAAFLVVQALGQAGVFSRTSEVSEDVKQREVVTASPEAVAPQQEQKIIQSQPTDPVPNDPKKDEPAREHREVLDLLGRFDAEMSVVIQSDGFKVWDAEAQNGLLAQKKTVVDALARNNVNEAYSQAIDLLEKGSTALANYEAAFSAALEEAKAAYQDDNYDVAAIAIRRALSLKPEDPNASALQGDIEKLAEILPLLEKARQAAVENNLEREKELSEEIYRLDPSREGYQARARDIGILIKDRQFEQVIARGLAAAKAEKVVELRSAHQAAKKIYPNREETKELARRLAMLQQDLQYREYVAEADRAVSTENWNAALVAFQNALQLKPNDGTMAQGVELARTIIGHENRINSFLNDPSRLSNESVKSAAKNALKEAETYQGLSKNLAASSKLLKRNIEDYNQPVDIWVNSDKNTHVSVRGVGQVGNVDRYKIQLKPGSYVLEGRREGYRVKAVPLEIRPGDMNVEIKVICDERL